jgi:flavin reductase (DIM6/NTAB) family NADH-FMN oxidoreductase RutF
MKIQRPPSAALLPVPAVLVTVPGDPPNMLTIAWAGMVNGQPPMLSVSVRPPRHSYPLLCAAREFVVNVPRTGQMEIVDMAGIESGADVDKFKDYGLTAAPAAKVKAPLIAECPVNIECVVRHQLALGTHDLFVGEIVAVHYDEDVLDPEGRPLVDKIDPLAYTSGEYRGVGERLQAHGFTVEKVKQRRQRRKQ